MMAMTEQLTEATKPRYNERQARFEPAEPEAFKPASMLIHTELRGMAARITGYPGTLADLVSDTQEMSQFITDYERGVLADILSVWAQFGSQIDELAK